MIEHLEFNPVDSNILLTASHDGTARLWDIDGILTTALPHEYPPTFAVFSPDNVHLLTGGGDSAVHLWDVVTGRKIAELDTARNCPRARRSAPMEVALQLHPSRAEFSSGTLRADERSRSSNLHSGLLQVQFSPKGDLLAAGSARRYRTVVGRGERRRSGRYPDKWELPQVVFSPDGDLVLAATSDNAAHLLKTDGTELKVLVGHEGRITAAAFSPDGQLVATASLDRTARIWSVKDGSSVATLKGHSDELTAVAFSPDGQSLLTASRDGTVRIWSVPDGKERVVLRGHSGAVSSAQFSPNGLYVVTASISGPHGPALGRAVGARDGSACQPGGGGQAAGTDTRGLQFGWNEGRNRVL